MSKSLEAQKQYEPNVFNVYVITQGISFSDGVWICVIGKRQVYLWVDRPNPIAWSCSCPQDMRCRCFHEHVAKVVERAAFHARPVVGVTFTVDIRCKNVRLMNVEVPLT